MLPARRVFHGRSVLYVICAVLLGGLLAASSRILRWKAISLKYEWKLGLLQLPEFDSQ